MIYPPIRYLDAEIIDAADRIVNKINAHGRNYTVQWCAKDVGSFLVRDVVVNFVFRSTNQSSWKFSIDLHPQFVQNDFQTTGYLVDQCEKWLESKKVQQP